MEDVKVLGYSFRPPFLSLMYCASCPCKPGRLFPERGDADEFMSLPSFNPDHVGFLKNIVPDIKLEQAVGRSRGDLTGV